MPGPDVGLPDEVASNAEAAIHNCKLVDPGLTLDFSRASLLSVEAVLAKFAGWLEGDPGNEIVDSLVRTMGCYVLEVARREFGGNYRWFEERGQPVLVCGDDETHVALIAMDKVRGRVGGDEGDNIPFFYEGFAEAAASPVPGRTVLYV